MKSKPKQDYRPQITEFTGSIKRDTEKTIGSIQMGGLINYFSFEDGEFFSVTYRLKPGNSPMSIPRDQSYQSKQRQAIGEPKYIKTKLHVRRERGGLSIGNAPPMSNPALQQQIEKIFDNYLEKAGIPDAQTIPLVPFKSPDQNNADKKNGNGNAKDVTGDPKTGSSKYALAG